MIKAIICSLALILVSFNFSLSFAESIVKSKHNLSAGGPGKVRGVSESEICIFCHAPHSVSSQAPLWNRYDSGQAYTPYKSNTLKASTGQPTGASKLCLSCHDGTVALGMVRSRSGAIQVTSPITPEENLGTDLSDDHPISFRYDSALAFSDRQLKDPSELTGAVLLDKDSQLQCTSCHDPHNDQFGYFLRVNSARGNLCLACHNLPGWNESAHKNSTASWNGRSTNPWRHATYKTVVDNGCGNCHDPHNAPGRAGLLNSASGNGKCSPCHNGNVAKKNIISEFNKLSNHSSAIQCSDCHNSHAVSGFASGIVPGAIRKTGGVNAQGLAIDEVNYEYELCFRCHGDNNLAQQTYVYRQFAEDNTRIQFDPANQSFHPLENIGKNADVPSLIQPLTTSSIIKCGDCHNSNSGPGNGGMGANGPHGSAYSPILERNLSLADNQQESLSTYALCYKCHDRNNILANRSFSGHKKHIVDQRTPCTACHDSHGVKSSTHLINFDRNIVSQNSSGSISFTDNGRFHGSCSLSCHNSDHNNKSY